MKRNKKGQFIKGFKPTNGFKKGIHNSPATEIKKGQHLSVKTEFKKGKHLGEKHPQWKGGRYKIPKGYIWCYAPNHPRAYRNGIYEHILVAEKKLGRYLKKGECVHHLNGLKDDNREENIIIFLSKRDHMKTHCKYKRIYQKPFPKPQIEKERIKLMINKRIYQVNKCKRCNKLFWTVTHKQQTCSISCGLYNRWGK